MATEKAKEFSLNGVITNPGKYYPNTDRHIIVTTKKGNKYNCTVPSTYFSNYHEDDIIKCVVQKDNKGESYTLTEKPYITLSPDRQSVERAFIRALVGTRFGPESANTLYNKISDMSELTYEKHFSSHVEDIFEENGEYKKETSEETTDVVIHPQEDKNRLMYQLVYGIDRVIAFMSKISTDYIASGNAEAVAVMKDCDLVEKQAKKLLFWWYKKRCLRRLHLLGLNNDQIRRCRMECDDIYLISLTNPFRLAPIPMEVCFFVLDAINQEYSAEDVRCGEIIRKIDSYVENSAYACVKVSTIEYHFKDFFQRLGRLEREYSIVLDGTFVFTKYNHKVSVYVADYIDRLVKQTAKDMLAVKKSDLMSVDGTSYIMKTLTQEQKDAIQCALRSRICVFTGGAGVGKSSCAREVYFNLKNRGLKLAPCAFTGKAVDRLNEIFSSNADGSKKADSEEHTIARTMDLMIIMADKDEKVHDFHTVLIDECSMVTTELFYRFITKFTHNFNIILMGDCNQLPPISWGFFMKQIIACERVPINTLTKNQRLMQASETEEEEKKFMEECKTKAPSEVSFDRTILDNCEELIDPQRDLESPMKFKVGKDGVNNEARGFYICDENIHFIRDLLEQLKTGGTRADEIKIISPYVKFTPFLNKMFQEVYSEDPEGVIKNDVTWKVGDRVMMLKNNYDKNVMNGAEGIVTQVGAKGVTVQFKAEIKDGVMVSADEDYELEFLYDVSEEDMLDIEGGGDDAGVSSDSKYEGKTLYTYMIQHSSCITVHKSQGSEYPFVIMYIPNTLDAKGEIPSFLNINLLYTGITRTRRTIWLVTSPKTLGKISMRKLPVRFDNLAARIFKMKDPELEAIITNTKIKRAGRSYTTSGGHPSGESEGVKRTALPPTDYDEDAHDADFSDDSD